MKKNKSFKSQKAGRDSHRETKPPKPVEAAAWYKKLVQLLVVTCILIITYICFSPALTNKKEFTNWDDNGYVLEQPLVKSLSNENIKTLFKPETQVMLNYHPLTMISLALNYQSSKLKAKPYALTNVLIHLLNTFLVFVLLFKLSNKKFWVGAIGSLWFGIHPMHVESVAWIAERKDVLYGFFFLLSCIAYLKYLETKKWVHLALVFVLFVLSCLSKAMAVPLPLVLLLIDFFYQRKINLKTIAEKIPFLIVAILAGYNAVNIQSHGAIAEYHVFTTLQRFMFAAYGFIMYWWKLFLPINLSAFYPYPMLDENQNLPLIFNLAPVLALILVLAPAWILYKRNNKETFRLFVFGMGFFILMVALVLQFISVGVVIMADRYSYLPYVGAFFIIGTLLNEGLQKKQTKIITAAGTVAFSVFLIVVCYNRVKVWNNSEVLWTDVINQYPYEIEQTGNVIKVKQAGVETAYKNRGNYYREHGMMDKAFEDYNMLVQVNAKDPGAFSNMGNMYALRKEFPKSLEMYSKSIERDSTNFDTYVNRGITLSTMDEHRKALGDFNKALALKPGTEHLYEKIAFENMKLRNFEQCISICTDLLAKNTGNVYAFFYRGIASANTGKITQAISDLQNTISLKPDHSEAWFNLAVLYNQTGNFKEALNAAQKAKSLNYPVNEGFLTELTAKAK
ncbi:MAG: tetratricopeptide repeat protein [Bacteroidia bacterium]